MAGRKVLGVALTILVGVVAWAGPRLVVSPDLFDFGEVSNGIVVQQVFILENAGDETLQITRVGYNCGCTSYTLTKWQLAPGERGELTVRFNTTGYSGGPQPVSQVVTVYSNDPAGAREIPIRGRVFPCSGPSAGASVEPEVPRALPREEVEAAPKPTLVNLQVDLVTPEDAEAVLPVLDLIESYGWYTTVYVTGQIALAYPDLVKEIHDRGHQIGVLGWEAGEDLLSMTEDELYDRLENAFLAVRAAVGEMRPAYIADFKPQGYRVNETLLRVLEMLEVRSCTGIFPNGPDHPHHIDAQAEHLVAIPTNLSVSFGAELDGENACSPDQRVLESVQTMVKAFDAAAPHYRPLAFSIRPSLVLAAPSGMRQITDLLNHLFVAGGKVVVTDFLTAVANPFIDWISVTGPAQPVFAGRNIDLEVRFRANCWCPVYYFRVYGCRGAGCEDWQFAAEYSPGGVPVGEHSFTLKVRVPYYSTDYALRLKVVGRACHGAACWPNATSFDKEQVVLVQVKSPLLSLLVFPIDWPTASLGDFQVAATEMLDHWRNESPFSECPGAVYAVVLPTGFGLNVCGNKLHDIWNMLVAELVKAGFGTVFELDFDFLVGLRPEGCVLDNGGTILGAQVSSSFVWVTAEMSGGHVEEPWIMSHEIGHYYGLADEYCSMDSQTPSNCCNCNNREWQPLNLCLSGDPNYLAAEHGCDPKSVECCYKECKKDGAPIVGCDATTNYRPCCRGNVARKDGIADGPWGPPRCIMSYGNADGDSLGGRHFCPLCMAHLASKIKCPTGLSSVTVGPASESWQDLVSNVVAITLVFHPDGGVVSGGVTRVEPGRPTAESACCGTHSLRFQGSAGDVLLQVPVVVFHGYAGPVREGVEPPGVDPQDYILFVKVPLMHGMRRLQVVDANGAVVYSEDLPLAQVEGDVRVAGEPVKGAVVMLRGPDVASTITDEEGHYVLSVARTGSYAVAVEPADPNLKPAYRSIDLEVFRTYTLDFALGRAGSISGEVSDESGRPVENVWVAPNPREYEPPYYRVREDGRYVIGGLDPGSYGVTIDAPGYGDWYIYVNGQYVKRGTSVQVNVELGKTTRVDFTQRPAGAFWNFEAYANQGAAEAEGWQFTGLWRLVTQDQVSPFSPNPTPFPSPVKAVYFGNQQGNYATVGTKGTEVAPATPELRILEAGTKSYGTLTSPQVSVAGMNWVELSFRYYRVVEYYPTGSFDRTIAEVSFDGGAWQEVWKADSKTLSERQWLQAGPVAIQVPSGASTMRVRFVFDSVDHYHNNYLGWLVDDVRIASSGAGTATFAYSNLVVNPTTGAAPLAVTASATVRNTGTVAGTETVRLLVNGSERASREVSLGPGASTAVSLTTTLSEPGTYSVTINGLPAVTVMVTGGEIFEARFDSPATGWTFEGLWRLASGTSCFTCGALAGTYAYYAVQGGCNYATGARTRGALTSPEFPLQGAQYVRVRFDQYRHVEDYTKAPYDRATLEVRFEGGAWVPVWTRSSQQASPECGPVTVGPFAIPAGATKMQVRFVFDSVDSYFNGFAGWAVDNVTVARATSGQPLSALTVQEEAPRDPKELISVFNIPNPVRDVRTTRFVVRGLEPEVVRVEVYDLAGRLVYREEGAGSEIVWHTQDLTGLPLANGVYLYVVHVRVAGQWISVGPQKLVILR